LTWEQIVSIEPRLKALAERARFDSRKSATEKTKLWHGIYKPSLHELVGWESRNKDLQNPKVFEIASWNICDMLKY